MAHKNNSEKLPGGLERTMLAASEFISQNKQWAENARQNWAANEYEAKSMPSSDPEDSE